MWPAAGRPRGCGRRARRAPRSRAGSGRGRGRRGDRGRGRRGAAGGEEADEGIEKGVVAVEQQGFGEAHAARLPGGENEGSDAHLESTARSPSPANTDMESERQLDGALRRTAIISAVTEMAISSGEMAPISSPMGAWMRSNTVRAMPAFSSSRITLSTLRLLPIMAM